MFNSKPARYDDSGFILVAAVVAFGIFAFATAILLSALSAALGTVLVIRKGV